MSKIIQFVIEGVPCAKGRPKFAVRGGFARAYTPKKTADNAKTIAGEAIVSMVGRKPLEGALNCVFEYFMPIPKSTSKKDREKILSNELRHIKKPDVDNLVKQTCDALNGICWIDDSQIVDLTAIKQYSDFPRTHIIITEVLK